MTASEGSSAHAGRRPEGPEYLLAWGLLVGEQAFAFWAARKHREPVALNKRSRK
jgi:hypothetical protein